MIVSQSIFPALQDIRPPLRSIVGFGDDEIAKHVHVTLDLESTSGSFYDRKSDHRLSDSRYTADARGFDAFAPSLTGNGSAYDGEIPLSDVNQKYLTSGRFWG